jgi:ABC-type bacteriocin/lantibiotic exporter with double-glycine peptidase domain
MSNLKIVDNELPTIPCGSNFINVPLCYQETEYTCGVACIQSILARYGMYYRQSALADILHSQPILGTDYKSILYLSKLLGLNASIEENMSIKNIKDYIDTNTAPILIIQAWRLEDDIKYSLDWKNAHYIIACGYNSDGVYAMDPNMLGNYAYLSFPELSERWHAVDKEETRHIKSGLIIENKNYPIIYNPKVIKHIK